MTPPPDDQYDLFLSHSSADKPWVADFAEQLRAAGQKVFYDAEAIPAGGNFRNDIATALHRTRTKLVLLLTHHSIKSGWVEWEFSLVANEDPANREGRIIFVYLEDVAKKVPPGWLYTASPVLLFDENRRGQDWQRLLKALGLATDALEMPPLEKLEKRESPQKLPPAPRFIALHPPGRLEHFVGRTVELGQLDEALLESREKAVAAVVGIGGQGKSALVWQWLTSRQAAIPHEVVFYSTAYRGGFSFLVFLERVLQELAPGRFDLREIPKTEDRVSCLTRVLAERPALVVIDGIERWLRGWEGAGDPMAAVRHDDLRPSAASVGLDLFLEEAAGLTNGTQLLLTTRALPRALKNRPVACVSTEAADSRDPKLEGLDDKAAIRLLRSLGVGGDDDELRSAAGEYGNHPLAVTALGSILAEFYGGDLARRPDVRDRVELEDKISVLLRDLETHRPDDVQILQVASLCFDEAPLPAIVAGIGDDTADGGEIRDRMAVLDRWGIVDFDGTGDGVVRLHPLIKNHFAAKVEDPAAIHRRLSLHFEEKEIPDDASRLDDVRPRILAIEHAFVAGDVERCCNLLSEKMNSLYSLSEWFNAWGEFRFATSFVERLAERATGPIRARLLADIAVYGIAEACYAGALTKLDEAISFWRASIRSDIGPDLRGHMAGALHNRARVRALIQGWEDALVDYDEAVTIWRELVQNEDLGHLQYDLAGTLQNRATLHAEHGDVNCALCDYNEAIAIYRGILKDSKGRDTRNDLARTLQNRGITQQAIGDVVRALADYDEAVAIRRQLVEEERRSDLRNELAGTLRNRASGRFLSKNFCGAVADCEEAVGILRDLIESLGRLDLLNFLAGTLQCRAVSRGECGDLAGALADCDEAVTTWRELVEQKGRRELRSELAEAILTRCIARAQRDPRAALSDASEGLAIWRQLVDEGNQQHRPPFLYYLAVAAKDFDVPAGQPQVGVARVHEGLDVLEAALSEADGWNEVLAKEAANFFEWTGAVLEQLRAAGLDTDRYTRLRRATEAASTPP